MALTEAQRERRRSYVGGSDVAAIMGEDQYRGPVDVWVEKIHGVKDESNEAMELGNVFERACREVGASRLGVELTSANPFRTLEGTKLGVNLDAWFERDGLIVPVECKTAGLLSEFSNIVNEFGEDGSDEVPTKYALQVHAQMLAVGAKESYISSFVSGRGHAMYHIPFNKDIGTLILDTVSDFWKCVESGEKPDDVPPSSNTMSRIRRLPKTVIDLGMEKAYTDIVTWQALNEESKDLKTRLDEAKDRVRERLGLAECGLLKPTKEQIAILAGVLDIGVDKAAEKIALTFNEQATGGVLTQKLKDDYPAVYAAVRNPGRHRVMRLGKVKKGVKVNAKFEDVKLGSTHEDAEFEAGAKS